MAVEAGAACVYERKQLRQGRVLLARDSGNGPAAGTLGAVLGPGAIAAGWLRCLAVNEACALAAGWFCCLAVNEAGLRA
ncbi:hypothetical protein K0T92_23625 [Paenibacillus oenotherae]|uniref:Uncharacterized protein n=1 Tax=Paenibacillus oenotherae TaxID=1435645 RepID=A0ABS7DD00_9BACL|nr:hypothetical protein [Paenibacillus oenotherae]MBW7477705.1 hypothetical protein [Paenibacillus oenotherae]